MEYEYEFNGIETWAGDLIFSITNYYDLGGFRCEECHKKLVEWVEEYYL